MISGQPHVRVLHPVSRQADPPAAGAPPATHPSTRIPSVRVIPPAVPATEPSPAAPGTREDPAGDASVADSPSAADLAQRAAAADVPDAPASAANMGTVDPATEADLAEDAQTVVLPGVAERGADARTELPPPDDDGTGPLWAALREDRFVLSRCRDCRSWLPPRLERCGHCAGPTAFEPAAGTGVVDSYLVIRHPSVPAFAGRSPYVLALVTLDEGVRLPGRLDGVAPAEARIGQPVRAAFHVRPGADTPGVIFRPRQPAGVGAR
ncbi:Zn-ribbon domain-containing OB-fold protein [Frankia sp. QA3]|uniref:Zn-ribbon domain-containing OB-fold protein n=1 Tax=Frankia sp. QA3 TaxID=710111 RepID=UPI000269C0EE|nr:OB-fold domain-containing protein [Frankia sp. QA3]EIV92051.1 putative nucleic-acid-binding protein containing a Zn-ribbon [Frankia sp. QA3]